ncbi:type IV pili methyl-accepting chemotaxis transducer N-terminal domain-containing protein [Aestuariibius insulae]|uniref:type IV pili methyl-accepting chemotaxis transducer N-terminal domain-containing protein n=1 Tax=Aestuariibius insulae TaxID=2058287 RepID=UPI00345E90E5
MRFPSSRQPRAATGIGLAILLVTTPISAERSALPLAKMPVPHDIGGSERVDFSGKLRMLSQRIAAAACNLSAGNKTAAAKQILASTVFEFEVIISALEFGNADLNIIGTEQRHETRLAITDLREQWGPIKQAAETITLSGLSTEDLDAIFSGNLALLEKAQHLVSEMSAQYSDPAKMRRSDARLIDLSGRQRMLTQKISKEACYLWSEDIAQASTDDLKATMSLFETSLAALMTGAPEEDIAPPPTPEIEAGLARVEEKWTATKVKLNRLAAGGTLTAKETEQIFDELNILLRDMNSVVWLYTNFAKRAL